MRVVRSLSRKCRWVVGEWKSVVTLEKCWPMVQGTLDWSPCGKVPDRETEKRGVEVVDFAGVVER